jgi:predicted PurR-regulated permease PerM
VSILVLLLLAFATLGILRSFLAPLVWAVIVAFVTWPLFRRLRDRLKRPGLSAALMTAAIAIVVGVPVALVLGSLASEATELVRSVGGWLAEGSPLPAWLEAQPWFEFVRERALASMADPDRAREAATTALQAISQRSLQIASGIVTNTMLFFVMLLTTYSLYMNGEVIANGSRRLFTRLFPAAPPGFFDTVGDSVQAVVIGLLGTALVQGTMAGVGLWIAGVPSPTALGALTAVLSFVPGGAVAPTLGGVIWLAASGHTTAAVLLGIWMVVVGSIDNVLRPVLIGGRAEIPFLLIFLGIMGGLAAFGLLGLFLGPVLLSVAFTLVAQAAREDPQA